MLGAVRPSLAIWYLHEMFHHKIESFAIRLEIVERVPRYCHYRKVVYNPRRDQQSDDPLGRWSRPRRYAPAARSSRAASITPLMPALSREYGVG